jgi:WD40 repeat protein
VRTKKLLRVLTEHKLSVESLAFAPGELLASGSADGTVRLWSLEGKALASMGGGAVGVRCVAFSPDGRLLAAGGTDGAIRLWRVRDRRELSRTAAHKNTVYCVTFNPTGTLLASAGFDGAIHVWAVRRK